MMQIIDLPTEIQERIYYLSLRNLRNKSARRIQRWFYRTIAGSVLKMKEYVQERYGANIDILSAPLCLSTMEAYATETGTVTKAVKLYAVQRLFDAEAGSLPSAMLLQTERACRRICGQAGFFELYTGVMERFFRIQEALDAAELDDDAFFWDE